MNDDENESIGRTTRRLTRDIARDAFTYTPETSDEPRDPPWLRWTKFVALVLFAAALFGFLSFGEYYLEQYALAKHPTGHAAVGQGDADPMGQMKLRIAIGAVIGGSIGLVYVVRCIVKDVDP